MPFNKASSDEELREAWLVRAGDALGRYAALGGTVEFAEARDEETGTTTLVVILPHDTAIPLVIAASKGRLMERVGVRLPDVPPVVATEVDGGGQRQAETTNVAFGLMFE